MGRDREELGIGEQMGGFEDQRLPRGTLPIHAQPRPSRSLRVEPEAMSPVVVGVGRYSKSLDEKLPFLAEREEKGAVPIPHKNLVFAGWNAIADVALKCRIEQRPKS